MAEVYLARALDAAGFARPVAIKKILPQFSNNARFTDMLKDEAKITVSLTHPNIAQVFELGLDGDDYFIVMEYVQGRPLNKLMQRVDEQGLSAIPVPHAAFIMAEVAKGLDHAHGQNRNIVHRDVSPQNVLLAYSGDVKLIDFGIARAEGRLNQTHQGVIKGKLRYLAPEIAAGREPDHRADIFCCGIVLFEMLTGEAMFAPRSDLEAIELATRARVKSPRSRNPAVPESLDAIVMRALRRERNERYASAHELHAELMRFLRTFEPNYSETALAGFMRTLFRPEIVLERTLNAAAAALVDEQAAVVVDEPTVASTPKRAAYQQLVTRPEHLMDEATSPGESMVLVGGADGGEAMAVVPADATPVPPADQQSPFTRPPLGGPHSSPRAAEFLHFGTTAAKPVPDAPEPAETSSLEIEPPEPVPVDPSLEWPLPSPAPKRRILALAVFAGVILLTAIMLSLRAPAPVRPGVVSVEPAIEPVAVPAALTLHVQPDVPISVYLDGRAVHARKMSPVVVSAVTPDRIHRVRVSADGYRPTTLSRVLKAGEQRTIELTLVRLTGSIRVLQAVGPIQTSAGRVLDDRIVDVPLHVPVRVTVARPGQPPFEKEVTLTSPHEVELIVPAAKPLSAPAAKPAAAAPQRRARPRPRERPKGILTIKSRPYSIVYVDGQRRGQTPLTLKLAAGEHRIMLESPTGKTLAVQRSVTAGRTTTFMYRWPP